MSAATSSTYRKPYPSGRSTGKNHEKIILRPAALRPAGTPQTLRIRVASGLALLGLLTAVGLFASHPAHSVGGPVPVTVTNAPLATRPIDIATPAQPFAKQMDLTFAGGTASQSFPVPANKRLVLTYISSNCAVAPGAKAFFDLSTTVNGQQVESHLPFTSQGAIFGHDAFALSCPVTIYADSGTVVTVSVLDNDTVGSGGLIVGLYGYYVDVP